MSPRKTTSAPRQVTGARKGTRAGAADSKLWQGRFNLGMASSMEALSFSLHFDEKLYREDIEGSQAHAKGLQAAGVLTAAEQKAIEKGLEGIRNDLDAGLAIFSPADEDIHMAIERVLTERIGDVGKKLHTGRSRNDQIATDFKLYVRRRAKEIDALVLELQKVLYHKARQYETLIMPGYTHVQQAQPIYASHYLLSFLWALQRDRSRLQHVMQTSEEMPLGSGALAGSSFPYKRSVVARELGFPKVSQNSIDATSHRDFALELLHAIASLGALMSRYAEDWVIWSTSEFGFLRLGEAFTSGSSMMPQKKNPDSMELIRGKAGRLLGNYTRLFTVIKGAPMCYSRDLQEDKEPVFDSVETVTTCLKVMAEAVETMELVPKAILNKMHPTLLATDLADMLVEQGMAFRDAHHVVGRLVGRAEALGVPFLELPEIEWEGIPDAGRLRRRLTFAFSIERRNIEGGTGSRSVLKQLKAAARLIGE